jgi:hypothetical protein
MKLPKLLRTLATISLTVGLVSLFGNIILSVFLDDGPILLFQLPRTALALIIATVSFVVMLASLVGSVILGKAENESLRRSGLAATAKILAVDDTGITINKNPVARIKLEVFPPSGTPFEAVAEELISRLEVGSISPGVEVTVRYNPTTKEVALERVK